MARKKIQEKTKPRILRRLLPAAAAAAVLAAAAFFLLRPSARDFSQLRGDRDFNVILVSVDTLRADRIGCYGFDRIKTPTMDLFAERGVKFDRCYAPTPLTLPSHTTLFTGTQPIFHGVRDNGGFLVPPELTTMAELFKDRGYETAAFVAAYVLDSKWGLDRGFNTYFDQFDLSRFERISLAMVQRPGNEVMDETLAWIEKNKDERFFAFIHLYDPHTPYEPPPPYDAKYPHHPYLGEIAFTDSQLGRLWAYLENNDLLDDLLLVFLADHGESLGEHDETTHGFFVYQGAIHVPLIFVTPFPELQGVSTSQVSGLVDVLPTICEMAGLPVPADVQGRSLVPQFFRPDKTEHAFAYSETFYPRFHYGWSELKSIQDDRFKIILAPVPELYDIGNDPREQKNLVYLEKPTFETFTAHAERYIEEAGQGALEVDLQKIDEETREKLAALGYVGAFVDPARSHGRRLANPRDKIGVFNDLSRAREIGMAGRTEEAVAIMETIIAEDPDIAQAHFSLGNIYFKAQEFEKAVAAFKRALDIKPDDTFAAINIANSYLGMGRFDDVEAFILDFQAKGFEDAQLYHLLGNMHFARKNYDKAELYFEKSLNRNEDSASSHSSLGAIAIARDDLGRAETHLRTALAMNPKLSNLHFNMAQLHEKRGDLKAAEASYLREIEYSPEHFRALFNLARIYRTAGREAEEYETLRRAVAADPNFPLNYFYLARIHLRRGENYREAIDLVQTGLDLKPGAEDLPLGYFLLADLYNRLGDTRRSAEYAARGKELAKAAGHRIPCP
ncbi:MAG: sulfatase-like hydrolase/transferase [Acidobacteriota bacterium]|nr:sulfatase-like hydrolase/transferase [Acidobacteriota bacterium]